MDMMLNGKPADISDFEADACFHGESLTRTTG